MEFHDIARSVAVGKITQAELAERLGLSLSQVHDRLNGQVAFKPAEIRRLMQVMPDAGLPNWLLEGTVFAVAERPIPNAGSGQLLDQALESLFSVVQTIVAVHHALEDQRVDHRDRQRILDAVSAAQIELATLRQIVTSQ